MATLIEWYRKTGLFSEEEIPGGTMLPVFACSEIAVMDIDEVEHKTEYVSAVWNDQGNNEFEFSTTSESRYDLEEKMIHAEDWEDVLQMRDELVQNGLDEEATKEKYPEQYEEVRKLLSDFLIYNGWDLNSAEE